MIKNLKQNLKKKKGFTLIELIIVVAIIAILGGLVIPKLMGTQDNAKKKADIANGKVIHDAVATLITQDEITLKTGDDTEFVVEKPTALGANPSADEKATNAIQTALSNYLQTIPKPKYNSTTYTQFFVTIDDDDKDITIEVTKADGSDGIQVYPEPEDDYAK